MGSACCIAARDGTLSNRGRIETFHRNAIYSPSWSFQDSERCMEFEAVNPTYRSSFAIESPPYRSSHESSRETSLSMKREEDLDRSDFSGRERPMENSEIIASQSTTFEGLVANPASLHSDLSMPGDNNSEVLSTPEIVNTSAPKLSVSLPSSSSFLRSLPTKSIQSKRVHHSPGHQLSRQISDSQVLGLNSPNRNSISDQRPSFTLTTSCNDLMTGSQYGSSDRWSMYTFSELVASTQRGRWSSDSDCSGSSRGKISESSGRFSHSPSNHPQTCGACTKLLTERSPRSSNKIISSNQLSVAAVLFCGHVYHADCLESMTSEADRFDPSCPICIIGEKQMSKMSKKDYRAEMALKSRHHKMSRSRVMDSHFNAEFEVLDRLKNTAEGEVPKTEASSSLRSSIGSRHFSLGSRKKRFWTRNHKD